MNTERGCAVLKPMESFIKSEVEKSCSDLLAILQSKNTEVKGTKERKEYIQDGETLVSITHDKEAVRRFPDGYSKKFLESFVIEGLCYLTGEMDRTVSKGAYTENYPNHRSKI